MGFSTGADRHSEIITGPQARERPRMKSVQPREPGEKGNRGRVTPRSGAVAQESLLRSCGLKDADGRARAGRGGSRR